MSIEAMYSAAQQSSSVRKLWYLKATLFILLLWRALAFAIFLGEKLGFRPGPPASSFLETAKGLPRLVARFALYLFTHTDLFRVFIDHPASSFYQLLMLVVVLAALVGVQRGALWALRLSSVIFCLFVLLLGNMLLDTVFNYSNFPIKTLALLFYLINLAGLLFFAWAFSLTLRQEVLATFSRRAAYPSGEG